MHNNHATTRITTTQMFYIYCMRCYIQHVFPMQTTRLP